MSALRTNIIDTSQGLSRELGIEGLDESLPARWRLAVLEVVQDPLTLLIDVSLDDFAESDGGVAADLLDGALVEGGDGLLVVPVLGWGVEEDALGAVLVGELDDELGFLVAEGAVGLALPTAGDELGEGWVGGEDGSTLR